VPSHGPLPHWCAARPPVEKTASCGLEDQSLLSVTGPGTPKCIRMAIQHPVPYFLFSGLRTRHTDECSLLLSTQLKIVTDVINGDKLWANGDKLWVPKSTILAPTFDKHPVKTVSVSLLFS
jgi:hypothetical protein